MKFLILVAWAVVAVSGKPAADNFVFEVPLSTNGQVMAEVFRANFSKSTLSEAFGNVSVSYGNENVFLWASGGGIDVVYPEGSYTPAESPVGGFGLWTNNELTTQAIFQYGVFFPAGFNFVKGGKLPGMYGGKLSCSGGDPAYDCFSTRLMWREGGQGELYLYANREAQDPIICETANNHCDPQWGWSLNRGAFTFQTNAWTNIEERIVLNTPGVRNGQLIIKVNGEELIRYDNLVFRIEDYPDMSISGLDVETFFGGNTPDWASPVRQVSKFRDFVLYNE